MTISVPPYTPDSIDFGLVHNVQVSTSQLSGLSQTLELPGARWKASLHYSNLSGSEARIMKAWLISLKGMANRFYLHDFSQPNPTAAPGTISAVLPGSTARVLNITTTGADFSIGDYLQVGAELKMIVAIPSADHYTIEPAMRDQTPVGLAVVATQATGIFMLSSNDQSYWSAAGKASLSDISFECVEIFWSPKVSQDLTFSWNEE